MTTARVCNTDTHAVMETISQSLDFTLDVHIDFVSVLFAGHPYQCSMNINIHMHFVLTM